LIEYRPKDTEMKSVTEFASFTLNQGLKTRAALVAEGKAAEELLSGLGEAFKFEGDKLKYFANALEVAGQNSENIKRVIVLSLNEGENPPAKAVKLEEMFYLPEFHIDPKAQAPRQKEEKRGGRGQHRGGGRDKKKDSPWGPAPEEKAAKPNKPSGKPVASKPAQNG
jgi:hypothetical protein